MSFEKDLKFISSFHDDFMNQSLKIGELCGKEDPKCFEDAKDFFECHKIFNSRSRYDALSSSKDSPIKLKIKNSPDSSYKTNLRVQVDIAMKDLTTKEIIDFFTSRIVFRASCISYKACEFSSGFYRPILKYLGAKNINKLREEKYCKTGGNLYNYICEFGNSEAILALKNGSERIVILQMGKSDSFPYGAHHVREFKKKV